MAIRLNKPLGTDIYNIDVHNANSTLIEQAINQLLNDVNNIKTTLPTKFNYKQVSTLDVSTVEGNRIYFVTGALTGDVPAVGNLPSGGHVIISYEDNNMSVITLISGDGRLFQKNSTDGIWKALTSTVVDNLTTDDSYNSLSAKQGKLLNEKKLDIFYLTADDELNVNIINSGIYIGSKLKSVSGECPPVSATTTLENFVLLSLGKIGELCVQTCWLANENTCYTRYGCVREESNSFEFSFWNNSSNDEGGTNDSEINLQLDNLNEEVQTLKNNQITVELIQI